MSSGLAIIFKAGYHCCMDKSNRMTKTEARQALGVDNDRRLALALGINAQAVYQWPEDEPIPEAREWQIKVILAEKGPAVNQICSNRKTNHNQ